MDHWQTIEEQNSKKKKKKGYVCFDSLYFGLVQFDVFLGLLDDFLG